MTAYLAGFTLGISLILAIGAQNAFVLKQGLKQQHVFVTCLICALSDAILITLGVAGFGAVVKQYPEIEQIARFGGAAFLLVYGAKSFYTAATTQHSLEAEGANVSKAIPVILTCLAFTWLNPHVYLDTVVLLGSISTQYGAENIFFGAGAVTGSFVFFFSLGYGARLLKPFFIKPASWKILEVVIGFTMWVIAASLF